jgi:hypothetical protein
MPKVDTIVTHGVKVFNGMFEAMVMYCRRVGVRLQEFDACEGNVLVARSHGPDNFANTPTVFDLLGSLKFGVFSGVIRTGGGVEQSQPGKVGW